MTHKLTSPLKGYNPLIIRCNRLIEAFAKSDDERDFFLDRTEGFILYIDLDKNDDDLQLFEQEFSQLSARLVPIPKLTSYETKKIMEGFVNEKVYDIDTKEKLIDIISGKEARDNFLEFVYDHHAELEKWQQYYQERARIRIIEWLRENDFDFVFEEDLDMPKKTLEKLKEHLFEETLPKDLVSGRKNLVSKAKTYYSNDALNPRPKRGRPPKQSIKTEIETENSRDIYTQVPSSCRPFLFTPDITQASGASFSSKFESEEELIASRRQKLGQELEVVNLEDQLKTLQKLSTSTTSFTPEELGKPKKKRGSKKNP